MEAKELPGTQPERSRSGVPTGCYPSIHVLHPSGHCQGARVPSGAVGKQTMRRDWDNQREAHTRWTASWGWADKVANTRQLETTETDSLTVLQIRSPKSRCLGGRESVPGRSPSSGGVLATTCVPWLLPCSLVLGDGSFKASPHLCLHVHRHLPVCVCVHTSSPFQTPVLWG